MSKITYSNKNDINTTATPEVNKVTAANMNEIKTVVNNNDDTLENTNVILSNIKGKILWTNPNPTSSFASQTITLSESIANYDCYEIIFTQAALRSDPTDLANRLMSTGKVPVGYGTVLNYAVNNRYRLVNRTTGNTQMTILDAYNGGQVDNDKCTPIYVIGYNTGLF